MGQLVYSKGGRLERVHPGTQPRGGFDLGDPPMVGRALAKHRQLVSSDASPVRRDVTREAIRAATVTPAPEEVPVRVARIRQAIRRLDSDNPQHFTGDGRPQVEAIEAVLGWDISAAERDHAFEDEGGKPQAAEEEAQA